jgi:hypothetical protein
MNSFESAPCCSEGKKRQPKRSRWPGKKECLFEEGIKAENIACKREAIEFFI